MDEQNNNNGSIPVIAIDGPSGSGKGTLCQMLAAHLGWYLLDSGALYRLVALSAQENSIAWDDEPGLASIAAQLDVLFAPGEHGEPTTVILNGEDVTDKLRLEESGDGASKVAVFPAVRQALLKRQHDFRQLPGLVADGRDMGTVVFQDAPLKVFLTASAEERAERRYKQLKSKGESASLANLLDELRQRDARDQQRQVAPLKPAEDAIVLDSTGMSIDDVFAKVLSLLEERQMYRTDS